MDFTQKETEVRNSVVNTNQSINNNDVYEELILRQLESINGSNLQLENGAFMEVIPHFVTDSNNTNSRLKLAISSTEIVDANYNTAFAVLDSGKMLSKDGMSNLSSDSVGLWLYGSNYLGTAVFGATGDQNKFVALADNLIPTNYLTFTFKGGQINGINIPQNNPLIGTSITITGTTVTFEDKGRGIAPNQYSDFINSIMGQLNLNSKIITSNGNDFPNPSGGNPFNNYMIYYNCDQFSLIFEERGELIQGGNPTNNMLTTYGLQTYLSNCVNNLYNNDQIGYTQANNIQSNQSNWSKGVNFMNSILDI